MILYMYPCIVSTLNLITSIISLSSSPPDSTQRSFTISYLNHFVLWLSEFHQGHLYDHGFGTTHWLQQLLTTKETIVCGFSCTMGHSFICMMHASNMPKILEATLFSLFYNLDKVREAEILFSLTSWDSLFCP